MNIIHTAFITGANSGLGFETARKLAKQGASRVILGCRNKEKAIKAQQELKAQTGRDVFEIEIIDVSDVASSANAVTRLSELGVKIDLLLLNASKDSLERVITDGGFELTLATNLVGHHVLTVELINQNVLSEDARIVMSTSETIRRMAKNKIYNYEELALKEDSSFNAVLGMLKGEIPKKHNNLLPMGMLSYGPSGGYLSWHSACHHLWLYLRYLQV